MSKNVVVIAGPSGSGKNAVTKIIEERYPRVTHLVTVTTRSPRPGEIDGVDYHFISQEEFDREVGEGDIVGQRFSPVLGGVSYGMRESELARLLQTHSIVIALVDVTGADYLKQRFNATTIFLEPESIDEFKMRLRERNPEWSEAEFNTRMQLTDTELTVHAEQYDYRVVSAYGALDNAVEEILDILKKEGYTLT